MGLFFPWTFETLGMTARIPIPYIKMHFISFWKTWTSSHGILKRKGFCCCFRKLLNSTSNTTVWGHCHLKPRLAVIGLQSGYRGQVGSLSQGWRLETCLTGWWEAAENTPKIFYKVTILIYSHAAEPLLKIHASACSFLQLEFRLIKHLYFF